jgi:hypothetical protein
MHHQISAARAVLIVLIAAVMNIGVASLLAVASQAARRSLARRRPGGRHQA